MLASQEYVADGPREAEALIAICWLTLLLRRVARLLGLCLGAVDEAIELGDCKKEISFKRKSVVMAVPYYITIYT